MASDVMEPQASSPVPDAVPDVEEPGLLSVMMAEVLGSPVNIALLAAIAFLAYKLIRGDGRRGREGEGEERPVRREPELPKLKKRDMGIEELGKYDGKTEGGEGRILIAVNGKVFDVTRGKKFYGPGGPYSAFGGKDASRSLATFAIDAVRDTYDDLSDLNTMQMDSVREWEMQFTEKYDFVGRLLRPGEEPTSYSDEEDDTSQTENKNESENDKAKDE